MALVWNNILELEQDLKELKDRENKIRKEIEELSTKTMPFPRHKKDFYEKSRPEKLVSTLNNMSFTDMDEFEKEKMMKKRRLGMIG